MTTITRGFIRVAMLTFISGMVLLGRGTDWRKEAIDKLHSLFEKQHTSQAQLDPRVPSADATPATLAPARVRAAYQDLTPAERMLKQEAVIAKLEAAGKSPAEIRATLSPAGLLAGTGSISGFVYESDGTTSIISSLVYLYDEYGYFVDMEWTDETGAYQITELAAGNYYVQSRNYSFVQVYYDGVLDPADATPVAVLDGQDTPNINFTLRPRVVIAGRVFKADGVTPIANQSASFRRYVEEYNYGRADYLLGFNITTLGDSGEYAISVNPEDIRLEALVEGYASAFYQDAADVESATIIVVAATADTIKGIDFTLTTVVAADDGYEPNNFVADAHAISYGDTVHARIDPPGDVDYFTFTGTANDTIRLIVDGEMIGSFIDSYLYLLDSSGTVTLAEDDNDLYALYGLDSRIESFVLPYGGNYFVKVRDFWNDGGPDFFYDLTLLKGPAPQAPTVDDPYEPNDTAAEADTIAYGDTVAAYINPSGEWDYYLFIGKVGDIVSIDTRARRDGSVTRAYIHLLDSLTNVLGYPQGVNGDYIIDSYTLPYTGVYYIQVAGGAWSSPATASDAFYTLWLIKGGLPYGAIVGTATDAAGGYITVSASILAYGADDLDGSSVASDYITTSDSGKYVIPYLPSGDYKIWFTPSNADTAYYIETWYDGAKDRESADVVSVTAPDTTTGIDFSVAIGGNIFGIVDFPTAYQTDVYNATQVISYNADGLGEFVYGSSLTFAGGFRFGLHTAGNYKLAATHLLTNLPATYYGGGAFYDANNSTTIALEAESTVHSQWTTLASGTGSISGTVYHTVDSAYDAALDGFILAYDSTGHILQAAWIGYDSETGAELAAGTYALPGLVEGSYSLRFFGKSAELDPDSVLNIWYPYVPLAPAGGDDVGDIYFTMIPTGAIPIEVTADSLAVTGVDFYLDGYSPQVGTEAVDHGLPTKFALRQNYPNPFNPSTTIQFELPTATDITITVYDILGREVVRLVEGHRGAGYHQVLWQGRTQKGREAATGVYIVRMVIPPSAGGTPGYARSMKTVLIK